MSEKAKRHYTPRELKPCVCIYCDAAFESRSNTIAYYCTPSCRDKARYRRDREKRLAAAKAYRDENHAHVRGLIKELRVKNPEKYAMQARASYERHREKRIAGALRYQKENKHVVYARNARRRYKQRAERVLVTPKDLDRQIARQRGECAYCGVAMTEPGRALKTSLQWDHVVPVSRGGMHSIGNLVASCRTCNISKYDRLLVEWTSRWYLTEKVAS